MLRGLSTVNFFADDVPAAQRWYAQLLGIEPYFARDIDGRTAYVEFRVGDYEHELGIVDRRFAASRATTPSGAVVYWHVEDVGAAFDRLLELGATVDEPVIERGPGFVTASVVDPFGNILGVMFNQHYVDTLKAHS